MSAPNGKSSWIKVLHHTFSQLQEEPRMNARTGRMLFVVVLASASAVVEGQTPARGRQGSAPATPPVETATVRQVMRGILFPNSNVVFAAQSDDPAKVKKAEDPSVAPNPLESVYGPWEAVANSGIALTESARLLEIPRRCSNSNAAPITEACSTCHDKYREKTPRCVE